MKLQWYLILGCIALVLFDNAKTMGADGLESVRKNVQELPVTATVIATMPADVGLGVPTNVLQLTVWPSGAVVATHTARADRSHTILPVYPPQRMKDPKPIKVGALSPSDACKEAASWIRDVLKEAYIPDDLEKRLVAIQRDPASESAIFCRYKIDGHAVQVSQTRAFMWVMIKPNGDSGMKASSPDATGEILRRFFTKGPEMAALKSQHKPGADTLGIHIPDPLVERPKAAEENWWGWRAWYSNGDAVAILLRKCAEDSAHTVATDEPWF